MTDDNSDLSPCPFCGGGETEIRTNYMPVRMGRKPEIIGVEINHWCDGLTRGAQRRSVHAHGRDRDDAIAAWNRRSVPFAPLAEVEPLRAEVERLTRERDEARAEVERLRAFEAAHRQLQADIDTAIRERDKARARALKLWAALEMVRDADNDCRVDGLATIPGAARRSIDEALDYAEVERLRADAADIATIAHSGGLTGLSEAEALVAIRRLTLRAWTDRHGRTGSRQVRSAPEAKS